MSGKTQLSPVKVRRLREKDLMVRYYLEGRTLSQVADKLMDEHRFKRSMSCISKVINGAIKEWKNERGEFIEYHKDIEIQKINNLEVTYFEAWEASKSAGNHEVQKLAPGKTPAAKKKLKEVIKTIRDTAGDPRFLLGIQWCIDKRCELLGHDAPQVIEANISGNITNTNIIRKVVFKTREYKAADQVYSQDTKPEGE